MDREALKQEAAEAALGYVEAGSLIGVGAGTTVEHFVRALAESDTRVRAAVAASDATRALLEAHGVAVVGLSEDALPLPVYIDGADEVDPGLRLIKGCGGALAREKVLAAASSLFVCIVDESKLSDHVGRAPIPVEVLPMAIHAVEREMRMLGGTSWIRSGFVTDNGNAVVDVSGIALEDAEDLERTIDAIPGVVACGLFARRPADVLVVGTESGVRRVDRRTWRE
ncbi:MAG: ribose-5-phosphate isomerase RpiA [Actinobacteria bacterium]|nr:ribose-5-phosphate isomerase RpiA [Actinomycetota bacterium]